MPSEVYTQKKRAPEAGIPAIPMEESLSNLQVVASKNQTLSPTEAAGAKAFSNLVGATYAAHKKELTHRIDIA